MSVHMCCEITQILFHMPVLTEECRLTGGEVINPVMNLKMLPHPYVTDSPRDR